MTAPAMPKLQPAHTPTLLYAIGGAVLLLIAYHLIHKR